MTSTPNPALLDCLAAALHRLDCLDPATLEEPELLDLLLERDLLLAELSRREVAADDGHRYALGA
jgi:hypothetical protein